MRERMQCVWVIGLVLVGIAWLATVPAHASHELFGVFEDWTTAPTIRSDRWVGSQFFPGHEIKRIVNGNRLEMRFRREGLTGSDVGAPGAGNVLEVVNPLSVDQMEAEFRARSVTVTGCPLDPTPSLVRAATVTLRRFSALEPGQEQAKPAGDLTGHVAGRIEARRVSNSTDPEGLLTVRAVVFRCLNPACTEVTVVVAVNLGQVEVGDDFRLRLIWDSPNNRFIARFNDNLDVLLSYDPTLNQSLAKTPSANIRLQHGAANCTVASGGPTVADAETDVGVVRTNLSAIIP